MLMLLCGTLPMTTNCAQLSSDGIQLRVSNDLGDESKKERQRHPNVAASLAAIVCLLGLDQLLCHSLPAVHATPTLSAARQKSV